MSTARDWVERKVDEGYAVIVCGHDDAIIGMLDGVVAYSSQKIVEGLMKQGMSEGEALEYLEFNIVGSYVTDSMPVFIDDIGMIKEDNNASA